MLEHFVLCFPQIAKKADHLSDLLPSFSVVYLSTLTRCRQQKISCLEPQTNSFKWMELVISNHFLCKDLVHHPIEPANHF